MTWYKSRMWSDSDNIGVMGFTLVELAITLVIIGLLIGMGAQMIGPLTKRVKRQETIETIRAARESLLGYALANHVLPSSLAAAGARDRDAFTKPLQYVLPTSPDVTTTTVCTVTSTNLTLVKCPDVTCATPDATYPDIAVLLVSGGGNYNLQTAVSGTTISIYPVGAAGIDDYAGDLNRLEEYDDIYEFISLNELKIKSGCASSLGFCGAYEVWNNLGGGWDFLVNGTRCLTAGNGALISSIMPGGSINRFAEGSSCATPAGGGGPVSISFSGARSADGNADCIVNFDGTDR